MFKTILFDVDGVLVDGSAWLPNLNRLHGITATMLQPFFQGPFQACLLGKADLKESLLPYLAQWNWQQSPTAFLDYWFQQQHVINDPLVQFIQQLRTQGLKCYLATQQEHYRTTYIWQEMGFANLFDGIFSSAYIGYMKNDFHFFEAVLNKLEDCQAQNVLFWDDSPTNVATASSIGIQAEVYHDLERFLPTMQSFHLHIHKEDEAQ